MTPLEIRRSDRFTQLAVAAADEAVEQAGWSEGLPVASERIGCVVATSIGGLYAQQRELEAFAARGPKRVSPLGIPRLIPNAPAATLSIRYDLRGESFGLTAACASGTQSIGAAMRMFYTDDVDAVLVGGTDTYGTDVMTAMLRVMGATSKSGVLRPFDRRRDGFIPGEGAAILALEREDVALGRGAEVLGELVSYGASNDARSLTAPHPGGRGVVQAMRIAIERAGITAEDVDYINAHGTSTRLNDRIETDAIKEVLGEHARQDSSFVSEGVDRASRRRGRQRRSCAHAARAEGRGRPADSGPRGAGRRAWTSTTSSANRVPSHVPPQVSA